MAFPFPRLVAAVLAAGAASPVPKTEEPEASPSVEVPPVPAKVEEPDFPRALFWARGDQLVPLVCVAAKGEPWIQGAACRKLILTPFRGRSSTAEVWGRRWLTQPVNQVGHAKTTVVQARDALGVGRDQQQEVSPEECLVVVPASAPAAMRVFPLAARSTHPLEWDTGTQKLRLVEGPYRGKKRRERGARTLNQVVTADGQHSWDGSAGAESVEILGAVDLGGAGAPLIVVHQRLADVGGDKVIVLDSALQPLASFHWSIYAE